MFPSFPGRMAHANAVRPPVIPGSMAESLVPGIVYGILYSASISPFSQHEDMEYVPSTDPLSGSILTIVSTRMFCTHNAPSGPVQESQGPESAVGMS